MMMMMISRTCLNLVSWNVLFFKLLSLQSLEQTRFANISITLYHDFHCNKYSITLTNNLMKNCQ